LTEKEEHDFLKEVWLAALSADKKEVKFSAVVDENGKLLTGEYNRRQFFQNVSKVKLSCFVILKIQY
jgi:hypothetical protein